LEQVKTVLEWARLGKLVFDLFVAVFSLKLIKKLLTYIPQVSTDWATIIAWWAAAFVLFLLVWWHEKRNESGQGPALQNPSNSLLNSSTFNATTYFGNAFISAMHQETSRCEV
jgi:cyanate permease